MELTGRIIADAQVSTLSDDRQVTNFTIVINDRYTTKAGDKREVATFIRCAYWVSPKAAPHLKKGVIISVYGRIGLDVYKGTDGEPHGTLTFHVNNMRFVTAARRDEQGTATPAAAPQPETVDDLPF